MKNTQHPTSNLQHPTCTALENIGRQALGVICRNLSAVAERREEISQPQSGWSGAVRKRCPERTTESVGFPPPLQDGANISQICRCGYSLVVGCRMLDVLCSNYRQFEKGSQNSRAFRLPLRHEVGERVGVRWCSGHRGAKPSQTFNVQHSAFDVQRSPKFP